MNALRFPGSVVIQHELGFTDEDRLAILAIIISDRKRRPDHLLRWDAVDLLRIQAHKILTEARNNVSLKAIRPQVGHHLQHWLVDEFGIGSLPAWVLRRGKPFLSIGLGTVF